MKNYKTRVLLATIYGNINDNYCNHLCLVAKSIKIKMPSLPAIKKEQKNILKKSKHNLNRNRQKAIEKNVELSNISQK